MNMLYNYQQEDMHKLLKELRNGKKRVLFEACTSYGKSYFALEFIKKCLRWNKKVIFCTNREQLVFQIQKDFSDIAEHCSIFKSGYGKLFNISKPIQIIMLQSFYSKPTILDDFVADVLIIDEVHLMYGGAMMSTLIEKQEQARLIGLTATGIDEKGYRLEGFDCIIDTYSVRELIKQGYLAQAECYTSSNVYDFSKLRMCGNDYNQQDVEEIVLDYTQVKKVVDAWVEKAENKKTIAFVNCIKQGELLKSEFIKRGYDAYILHSQIPNLQQYRAQLLEDFQNGSKKILINVQMLVEGFSDPNVECILLALLTRVERKIRQIYGRGLRKNEQKTKCIFIDCGGNFALHGLPDDIRFYKARQRQQDICLVKQCPECGAMVSKTTKTCPYCSYDFSAVQEETKPMKKKEIERLEKAFNMQLELKRQIAELVDERGYKNGYKWYLFIDCLKTKHATESSIQFFRRKLSKIKKIKQKNYKLAALQYD